MPLRRIRASKQEAEEALETNLSAEGIHLAEGRTMLNRHAATASALIVVRGALRVGVRDDDAELGEGDGVLMEAATTYSLQASEESVAVVFALSGEGEGAAE